MKRFLVVLLGVFISLCCAACGEDVADNNGELTPVTVVLDYVPNTNHTGLYVALEKGYYEEMGLDVKIIEPTEGATASLIAAGKGDFGISYQEDVTYALTSAEPLPIQAVATIIQHNTSAFASYAGKNIQSAKDFENKVYSGWGSPGEEAVIKAVMKAAGADPSTIKITSTDGGYEEMKDSVDLKWFYMAWDGILSKRAGIDINYLYLNELDPRLDYYTPVIITNNNILENDSEMAKKFMKATKKGYEFAIKNPFEAANILYKFAPDYDLDMLKESQEYLASRYQGNAESWGLMKDEVWNNYTSFMVENGLIEKGIDASQCYTNELLK